ncbi:hypothetical protein Tco_0807065, partial [Tanacetum coccineum]
MPDTVNISDSEDTDSAHLPNIKPRPEWLKPIPKEDIPATPEPDWIGKKKLSKSDLEGPTFKQVDLVNRDGHQLVPDVSKPLPLGGPPGQVGPPGQRFKRKEFYITRHSAPSDCTKVRSHMRILSVVSLKTLERYGYTYLKEIVLRRAGYKEYKIS